MFSSCQNINQLYVLLNIRGFLNLFQQKEVEHFLDLWFTFNDLKRFILKLKNINGFFHEISILTFDHLSEELPIFPFQFDF